MRLRKTARPVLLLSGLAADQTMAIGEAAERVSATSLRSLVRVVSLRKPPDIVIAYGFGVPIPNSHLIVEGLAIEQPVGAELRFGGEIRRSRTRAHLRPDIIWSFSCRIGQGQF